MKGRADLHAVRRILALLLVCTGGELRSIFTLPTSLWEIISSRREVRLRGLQFDMYDCVCACTCVHVCVCCRGKGGLAVSRAHRGRVRTLLFMSHLLLAVELF